MTPERAGIEIVPSSPWRTTPNQWFERASRWLYPYRPRFGDRRFWAVQFLVLLVGVVHTTLEALEMRGIIDLEAVSFWPTALFFVPVVYAALNFGFAGAVATAAWCTVVSIPNWVWLHEGAERLACITQVGVVDAIAFFVGQRVEREMVARRGAEAAGTALRASETKYRGLFESSPVPVLLLNVAGQVLEANPPAVALFQRDASSLQGANLADLLGAESAEKLFAPSGDARETRPPVVLVRSDASQLYLEPAVTRIADSQGVSVVQLLLRDVTEAQHREAGLRAYAAHILRAQEDERKRIAQELHDETVQALVMLCRRLDAVEKAGQSLPAPVTDGLHDSRRAAEHLVQGLRDFARGLRPPTLEDLGLVTSVRRLVVDMAERAHLEGLLKLEGVERRLPPDVELALFRVAQEALRNVERHARATQVAVTMGFSKQTATLDILDNGAGFALQSAVGDLAARGQLGLLGMQERAELLGGKLEIRTRPGHGTRVTASIPIEEAVIA